MAIMAAMGGTTTTSAVVMTVARTATTTTPMAAALTVICSTLQTHLLPGNCECTALPPPPSHLTSSVASSHHPVLLFHVAPLKWSHGVSILGFRPQTCLSPCTAPKPPHVHVGAGLLPPLPDITPPSTFSDDILVIYCIVPQFV